jgi:hypothetical protein
VSLSSCCCLPGFWCGVWLGRPRQLGLHSPSRSPMGKGKKARSSKRAIASKGTSNGVERGTAVEQSQRADVVTTTTETSNAAAGALASVLGISEEEAWRTINRAAEGCEEARAAIQQAMGGGGAQQQQQMATVTTLPASAVDDLMRKLLRGGMTLLPGCSSQQNIVLVESFLNDGEIALINRTPQMAESVEAGGDGMFPGLVGGDRYTDADGLSIFGTAKHRSWRIEAALSKLSQPLVQRLTAASECCCCCC